jgi:hypothetical protein
VGKPVLPDIDQVTNNEPGRSGIGNIPENGNGMFQYQGYTEQGQKSPETSFDRYRYNVSGGKIDRYDVDPDKNIVQTQIPGPERGILK